jgi:hypothetical protein
MAQKEVFSDLPQVRDAVGISRLGEIREIRDDHVRQPHRLTQLLHACAAVLGLVLDAAEDECQLGAVGHRGVVLSLGAAHTRTRAHTQRDSDRTDLQSPSACKSSSSSESVFAQKGLSSHRRS